MLELLANELGKRCPQVASSFRLQVCERVSLNNAEGDQGIYYDGVLDTSALIFILSGKVKCYYTKDDKDILLEIGQVNEILCYPPCWAAPGSIRIDAITNCKFLSLSIRQWDALYATDPREGDKMYKSFLQADRYKCRARIELLSMASTEEKLICLDENFPGYRHLPATLKADFIGVSAHTVRRVLKERDVDKK